jgi:hypothetical protein
MIEQISGEQATKLMERLETLDWQSSAPSPRPSFRIGIVVRDARERERIQKQLDPEVERFHVLSPMQVLAGFQFQTVIVTDCANRRYYDAGRAARDSYREWLAILERRTQNNHVIHL